MLRSFGMVVVLAALGGPAAAAPAPVECRVFADGRGDGTVEEQGAGVVPSDPALDVVAGSVRVDRETLTATLHLADLGGPTTSSPTGAQYTMLLDVNEQRLGLYALVAPTLRRAHFVVDPAAVQPGDVTRAGVGLTVDVARDRIEVTVRLAELRKQLPLNGRDLLSGFLGATQRHVGVADRSVATGVLVNVDTAASARGTYVLRGRSACAR